MGVAAAFAEAVQRALDLAGARQDGGKAACDRRFGVVVGVDAEALARDARGDDFGGDTADVVGERAAVGVAEDDPTGTGVMGGAQAGEGVIGIGLVAVEEMFGIEERLAPLGHAMRDGGADVVEVLVERDAERIGDVKIMGLADKTDGGRARVQDGGEDVVVFRRAARALGHAEGGHGGAGFRGGVEKGAVGGVRARPAAFDMVEAERVEGLSDADFLGRGELHALRLLAIAQRGVVEVEAVRHGVFPCRWRCA